ncbi:alpha-2B adrenergic receptor-like [Biomphalaria glabrata]|uniref:Alpha-2B adrenergic receptor-like n=1 Tax=Biomphalaria glabrata TaxID=6526 RepID=A0A9W3BE51_BIOGL|nr:alpha-2B adrenergic receptor-like [Biomphalaria glabrata]
MHSATNISKNITDNERQLYLSVLQQESTIAYIPTIVYLIILAVVGIPGNCLVLVVYLNKMTMKPLSTFIISMAVLDLVTCTLILPGEIYHLLHIWDFTEPLICQIYEFLSALLVISSGFMLVAIAMIRYMMICHSFKKQVTLTHAKCICSLNIFIATVASIPHGILKGKHSRQTQNPNIVGYYCQVDDSYVETIWPSLNSAFFFLLFFLTSCTVTFCYVRIGCAIRGHGQNVNQRSSLPASTKAAKDVTETDTAVNATVSKTDESRSTYGDTSESVVANETINNTASASIYRAHDTTAGLVPSVALEVDDINIETISHNSNDSAEETISTDKISKDDCSTDKMSLDNIVSKHTFDTDTPGDGKQVRPLQIRRKHLIRTHLMMIIVTLVFFLGFLPFIGLNVLLAVSPETVVSLEGWSLAMYQLFYDSIFVNSAANPIIYSLLDKKFKNICIKMFKNKHERR